MNITPHELLDLINEAAKQATADTAACFTQPNSVEQMETINLEQCKRIMATLAGAGICTPEETYGSNIQAAVKDACTAIDNLRSLCDERGKKLGRRCPTE